MTFTHWCKWKKLAIDRLYTDAAKSTMFHASNILAAIKTELQLFCNLTTVDIMTYLQQAQLFAS